MKEQVQNENIQEEIIEPEIVNNDVENDISSDNLENQNKEETSEEQEDQDYYKDKYFDTKSKVRKIYAERQKLYNENQHMKEMFNVAARDNLLMRYDLLQSDLNVIKQHREAARKSDDSKYMDMTDELYTKIINNISNFEREHPELFVENNEKKGDVKPEKITDNSEEDESVYNEDQIIAANLWLEENPELNVKSKSYNPHLEKKMMEFMEEFNDELYKVGRGDEILSDKYIEVLNEAKNHYKEELRKPRTSYKKSGASGVRSNMATKSNDSITIEPWERAGFMSLGLTEAEYLKNKAKYIK